MGGGAKAIHSRSCRKEITVTWIQASLTLSPRPFSLGHTQATLLELAWLSDSCLPNKIWGCKSSLRGNENWAGRGFRVMLLPHLQCTPLVVFLKRSLILSREMKDLFFNWLCLSPWLNCFSKKIKDPGMYVSKFITCSLSLKDRHHPHMQFRKPKRSQHLCGTWCLRVKSL